MENLTAGNNRALMPPPSSCSTPRRSQRPSPVSRSTPTPRKMQRLSLHSSTSSDNASSSDQPFSGQGSVLSGKFSENVKGQATNLDGHFCWACFTTDIDIAHMIGNKDPQVGLWAKLGLINFSLTSHENAIPLCPTCHRELDLTLDPGLIIVPTHLEYFIDFELNDRNGRAGRLGVRRVPTPDEYRHYVEGKGEYGTIACYITGGLYTPVFLKHYFFMGRAPEVHDALSYSRPWHGSPMAALRRAFVALGSGRIGMIPPKMKSDLKRLRDLYFYKDITPMTTEPAEDPTQHPHIPGAQKRNGSPLGNTSQQPPTKIHRRDYPGESQGDSCCFEARDDSPSWAFGPSTNAEEVIRRLAPILGRPPSENDDSQMRS